MPSIHQVFNSCGIASVLMALKPNKNKMLDAFFRKLEQRVSKELKISKDRHDFQDRVQFATAWLFIHALFNDERLFQHANDKLGMEHVKPLILSRFDEMLLYQKTKNNHKIESDMEKLAKKGTITRNLVDSYLDEQKTDIELKLLAAMLGLVFEPVPETEGGSTLGTIVQIDPRHPETYMKKVRLLAKFIVDGAVLANYEYHWMPLREIGEEPGFANDIAEISRLEDVELTPHYFKLNNPLSGMVLTVDKVSMLKRYTFYCFKLDTGLQENAFQAMRGLAR